MSDRPAPSTPCGMYGETPMVRVGRFSLSRMNSSPGIWIETDDGEGGQFNEAALEKAIEEFYREHF